MSTIAFNPGDKCCFTQAIASYSQTHDTIAVTVIKATATKVICETKPWKEKLVFTKRGNGTYRLKGLYGTMPLKHLT